MSKTEKLTLRCPGCKGTLIVDRTTGEVLSHQPHAQPIAGGRDFDALLSELDDEKDQAEEIFRREVAAHEDRDRLLEEKFREAMKRAEQEPDEAPPRRPFDFD